MCLLPHAGARDARAAEQAERREPRWLSLIAARLSGSPGLSCSSRSMVARARAHVADDQHVIDEDLRPFVNGEHRIDARAIGAVVRRPHRPWRSDIRGSDSSAR